MAFIINCGQLSWEMVDFKDLFRTSLFSLILLFGVTQVGLGGLILNVDYSEQNGIHSGAGAVGAAGDIWNGFDGGLDNTGNVDASGNPSDVGFFSQEILGFDSGEFSFGSDSLGQDYLFSSAGGQTPQTLADGTVVDSALRLTIFSPTGATNGLEAGGLYNLYLIGQGDQANQTSNFLLTQPGGFVNSTQIGRFPFDGNYIDGQNLTVFSGVTPTAFAGGVEFEIILFSSNGGSEFAAINGLQLVAVPEPSTTLSLAAILLTVCPLRRRRQT